MTKHKMWTKEELDLIRQGCSDKTIMTVTGRTLKAIKQKRWQITGHEVPSSDLFVDDKPREILPVSSFWSEEYKVSRICNLAEILGIRLKS